MIKIPYIPPIFHENRFVTNLKKKPNCYYYYYYYYYFFFFAKQCSVIGSDSKVPSFLHLKPDKSLSNITFTKKDANFANYANYANFRFR